MCAFYFQVQVKSQVNSPSPSQVSSHYVASRKSIKVRLESDSSRVALTRVYNSGDIFSSKLRAVISPRHNYGYFSLGDITVWGLIFIGQSIFSYFLPSANDNTFNIGLCSVYFLPW